jgi:hypothetical protein
MSNIDWVFIKRPLIFFVVAVVLAAALIGGGMQYEQAAETEYSSAISSLRNAHSRYENMVNDIDLLEQYTKRFTEYKATGLVGADRRLSWIESLEAVNADLKLPRLNYNLLSQEDFSRGELNAGRNVALNSSPMELDLSMLHEGDLFALFDGLGESIHNLFTVDSCTMRLESSIGASFKTNRPNLIGRCVIRWISIDVK